MNNQFDAWISVAAILGVIYGYFFAGYQSTKLCTAHFGDGSYGCYNPSPLRAFMSLFVLRLLTLLTQNRGLVMALLQVIKGFLSLIVMMLCILYSFAIYGRWLFAHKYEVLIPDTRKAPNTSFDTLFDAMTTLMQLMVGEGWHEVMNDTVRAAGWFSCIYFASFVLIISLFLVNILISSVLAAIDIVFTEVKEEHEVHCKATRARWSLPETVHLPSDELA